MAARGEPRPRSRGALALVAVLIGVMFAVAALQTTRSAPALESERAELINRVQAGEQAQDRLRVRSDELSTEIDRLRTVALGDDDQAVILRGQIDRLGPVVGTVAVTGPGMLVEVDDAPAGGTDARDRVLDIDLQILANGLWQAGAEAVAINGHRLSSLTAIRSAGRRDHRRLPVPDPAVPGRGHRQSAYAARPFRGDGRRRLVARTGHEPADGLRDQHPGIARAAGRPGPGPAPRPPGRAMIPLIGLLAGIVLGLILEPTVPQALQPYLPIAIVAAMDALFGAFRAYLEGTFSDRVFVVSFVSNVLIAAAIVYVGDQIGVGSQLSTAVVVVLGIRIFTNVAAIRRALIRA